MVDLLFYIFASLMLFSALAVVFNKKNAVNSAMCMIVTLVSTAALFILWKPIFWPFYKSSSMREPLWYSSFYNYALGCR